MKSKIILGLFLVFMAGCGPKYQWNQTSGKAGEGRCHLMITDQLGPFVEDSKCGR